MGATGNRSGEAGHDYVIVGAGSAGCVLADRLSRSGKYSVLVIEAGPTDRDPFISMPMGLFNVIQDQGRTWNYVLEPDATSGTVHYWMRGKLIGGSSSINGMLYFRGQPDDYDGWEALGCSGWGWEEMFRVFREMEDHELGDDGVRGVGGPLHVSIHRDRTPLTEAIISAGAELGLPFREDLNRPRQEGIGYSPRNIRKGRRVSAADAFLKPAMKRGNVTVVTGTYAEKLVFDGARVTGVQCHDGEKQVTYRADREVILSAGALQSPVLLMLSGIGPAGDLTSLGIPVVADSPNVGRNLREHKMITVNAKVRGHSLNQQYTGWRKYWNGARYFLSKGGPMAGTYEINAFIRTQPGLVQPDAQLTFWALTQDRNAPMELEADPGLMCMGYPLRTESQGQLRLRSADPRAMPSIQPNFLTSEHDRRVIVAMLRFMRRMFAQPVLAGMVEEETWPGSAVQTAEEILAAAFQDTSCMHTVGTCSMGGDSASVVDPFLRVRGVEGLRVVDCSVMPTHTSGNPNAPVMAMAWRASEFILEAAEDPN